MPELNQGSMEFMGSLLGPPRLHRKLRRLLDPDACRSDLISISFFIGKTRRIPLFGRFSSPVVALCAGMAAS